MQQIVFYITENVVFLVMPYIIHAFQIQGYSILILKLFTTLCNILCFKLTNMFDNIQEYARLWLNSIQYKDSANMTR